MAFIVALLTCWGASWIVVRSKAGALVRVPAAHLPIARDLVQCCGCVGFWLGLGYGLARTEEPLDFAFASAGVCALLDATYLYLRGVE